MPWAADAPQAGFSSANRTWLKVDPVHTGFAVDRQASDPASTLGYTRQLLALRRTHAALVHGEIELLEGPDDILAFLRHDDQAGSVLCVFNLGETPDHWAPPARLGALTLLATESKVASGSLPETLAPGTGYWAAVSAG